MIPSGMIIDAQDCYLQEYPQKLPSPHIRRELDGPLLASQAVRHCWGQLEEPYLPITRDAKCIHLLTSYAARLEKLFYRSLAAFPNSSAYGCTIRVSPCVYLFVSRVVVMSPPKELEN